jgi:hypothetical protein
MMAMSRADAEHKRALSAMSEQAPLVCANPQEALQRCRGMLLSFKLESPTKPDTVVMNVYQVAELCKARNGNEASCWWACIGSACPFANAFTGHSGLTSCVLTGISAEDYSLLG